MKQKTMISVEMEGFLGFKWSRKTRRVRALSIREKMDGTVPSALT